MADATEGLAPLQPEAPGASDVVPPITGRFEEARGLPPSWYTSPEVYRLELARIFHKEWLCIGRADEVERPGDYLSLELLGEPLLLIRDGAGEVRVLSRVCRHRGMIVVTGSGSARALVCPYHTWTYALDGRLLTAPEMHRTPGFDLSGCRLPELRSEIWEGFVFVNFDPEAAPLGPSLAGLSALLERYDMAGMKTVRSVPFDMDCRWNWKLMCDNFGEVYHHLGTHAKTLEPVFPARQGTTLDTDSRYSVVYMHYRSGTSPAETVPDRTPRLPVLPGLSPDERRRVALVHVFPIGLIALYTDHMEFYRAFPEGPERTWLEKLFCVPPTVMAQPDFEASLGRLVDVYVRFRDEDTDICLGVQRGLASRFAEPGRLCHLEKCIWQFARYVETRIRGDSGQVSPG